MALAIKFQGMLRDGIVRDQSELARQARVTQPRMTQIMDLTFLAPDIQKEILYLCGDTAVTEKALRPITVEPSWVAQRRMWRSASVKVFYLGVARCRRLSTTYPSPLATDKINPIEQANSMTTFPSTLLPPSEQARRSTGKYCQRADPA
jgi:hypothetical protein